MHSIFKNKEYQKKFDEDGYIVIPFLSKEEKEDLLLLFERLKDKMVYNNGRIFRQTSK